MILKDRIADSMFQQLLLRPEEYEVIATPNLNGDYVSDAAAAQVGGLGIAPGGNVGDEAAVFEATHGTAPKYAGLDKINPGSVILSGVMMLEHMGWGEAAKLIVKGVEQAIAAGTVTYDLARQMPGSTEVSTTGIRRRGHRRNAELSMPFSLSLHAGDPARLATPLLAVALPSDKARAAHARAARQGARRCAHRVP